MNIPKANRISDIPTYYFAKKLAEIRQMNARGANIINLGIGSPDLPPPEEVTKVLIEEAQTDDVHGYQPYRGIPEYHKAVGVWYDRHFDVKLNTAKEVLPLLGSKEGIMHIHMSMLNVNDVVMVPDPGYMTYRMTALLAGAEIYPYPLTEANHWIPQLDKIPKDILKRTKIMWINYPHMPTGANITVDKLKQLVDFTRDNEIILCHDNPYVFIQNDHPVSIFQVDGAFDHCLELTSHSKCYHMAGWRIGTMVANSVIIDTVLKFKSNMDSGMFRPNLLAGAKALAIGDEWMASINLEYSKRKKVAHDIMDSLEVKYNPSSAGLFVWGEVPGNLNAEEFSEKLLYDTGVFITPGHIFGKNGQKHLRLSLTNPIAVLEEALDRIKKKKRSNEHNFV